MFGNRGAKPQKARDFTTLVNEGTEIEGKVTFSGTVLLNGRIRGEIISNDVLVVGERRRQRDDSRELSRSPARSSATSTTDRIELHAGAGLGDRPRWSSSTRALLEGQCRMTKGRPKDIGVSTSRTVSRSLRDRNAGNSRGACSK